MLSVVRQHDYGCFKKSPSRREYGESKRKNGRCIFTDVNTHAMTFLKNIAFPVLLATIWISLSEFVRNSFLIHDAWIEHYQKLGIVFPEQPVNGAVWGAWSLLFAIVIYVLFQKFPFWQTVLLSWLIGFALMWLVIGNLGVLPVAILPLALPLSFVEITVATFIVSRFSRNRS